jgi:hypothetical protein
VTTATLVNIWKSIGHTTGDEGDETRIQENQQEEEEQGRQEEEQYDAFKRGGFFSKKNHFYDGPT